MQHLTQQEALGDVGIDALIGRRPKAIVIDDHDDGADQHHQDESGPGPEVPGTGTPPGVGPATAETERFPGQLSLGGSRSRPTLQGSEFQLGSRVAPAG
jgi:hypothetical protein